MYIKVEGKIRKLLEEKMGIGHANACQIWKGLGDQGQPPYSWWIKPFNGLAYPAGRNWNEVKELFEIGE